MVDNPLDRTVQVALCMEGKVMLFSIDFSSILSATIWAFLSLVAGIILTVGLFGRDEFAICIIVSVEISWIVFLLLTLHGKKQEMKKTGRQLQCPKEK